MSSVRIWALESDYDAETVECLAKKLIAHLQLSNVFIRAVGKRAIPKRPKGSAANVLLRAVQNYLKQDDCVIFVLDTDGPMASHQRRQEAHSLINQVERVVADSNFAGKVYLACAVRELEAWLLIDCLGIFCYFASQRKPYKENCREKVTAHRSFSSLIRSYQSGNTELIVEAEMGGKGVKEYLIEFSEEILLALNPNMPQKNVSREKYREALSPDVAEHVVINNETLRRNNSLEHLGDLLTQYK
ncbi:hypothetical protein HYR99_11770 [Candidatus Poribacteria bacterium]|nr:hypothetical protein [Candidatus Poribacteria bacterium]